MATILNPAIEEYLTHLETPHDQVLAEMQRYGDERRFPYIGLHVGRILFLLARLMGARRAFEMGSGFGFSAYWLALGMGPEGRVTLTEHSPENSDRAREFFRRGGIEDRARFVVGDALQLLEEEEGPFDIILCDVDKPQYPAVPPLVKPRLRRGGLLLVDNMLSGGRVLEPPGDPATRGILELTQQLYQDPDFFTSLLPIRDGVTVSLKV